MKLMKFNFCIWLHSGSLNLYFMSTFFSQATQGHSVLSEGSSIKIFFILRSKSLKTAKCDLIWCTDFFFNLSFLFCDDYRLTHSVRNKTEIPFTLYPVSPMITSCETRVPNHNHIIKIIIQDTEHFHHHKYSSCCPFTAPSPSLSPPTPFLNSS